MSKNETREKKRGPGRPPAEEKTDEQRQDEAREALQKAHDLCCQKIVDGSTSYMAQGAKCARVGFPKERVMKGFDALEAIVREARETVQRVYEQPPTRAPVKRRVEL